jgi:transposase
MGKETFTMTLQEINKLEVINRTISSIITIREAAELLGLSERQVIRLKKGVSEHGPAFVIHKNRGRKPEHALSDDMKKQIVELKQSKYQEANFCHFQELLEEHEGINFSYPTVYRVLSQAGISSPKKHRKRKVHHRRKRKPQEGMLVQIDASPHPWIIGEKAFSLHGAIDDATGQILALFFRENECLEGYFQVMEQIINRYGIPISIYCDRHTIFISPKDGKLTIEEQLQGKQVNLTQFGRAVDELGITVIKAKSPQAKGRIERLWETLQSRLPVEFKVHEIRTMETANAFLKEFMDSYNARFAVEPEDPQTAFRQLDASIDLNTILCIKKERILINGSTFSYGGKHYQLMKNGKKTSFMHKAEITVLDSPKTGIKAMYADEVYEIQLLEERPKATHSVQKDRNNAKNRANHSPAPDHPWRSLDKKKPKLYYDEPDSEILAMLDELFSSKRAWA